MNKPIKNNCRINFKRGIKSFWLVLLLLLSISFIQAQQAAKPVMIEIDLAKKTTESLKPFWAWFGYDEPNYTYMKDGKSSLRKFHNSARYPCMFAAIVCWLPVMGKLL